MQIKSLIVMVAAMLAVLNASGVADAPIYLFISDAMAIVYYQQLVSNGSNSN